VAVRLFHNRVVKFAPFVGGVNVVYEKFIFLKMGGMIYQLQIKFQSIGNFNMTVLALKAT
jgi:hypothetical protein